ncbi:MAG: GNAT family N-acetyltransferase [Bacteroidota bacterium]
MEAKLEDAAFFLQLLNSPNWLEFIGNRNIHALEDARAYIQMALLNSYQVNGFGLYKMVLKEQQQAIGICGLVKRPSLEHPDLGFAILPQFEGQGYTSEAAMATLQYAQLKLKLEPILAITTQKNLGSRHLLEKIGMQFIRKRTEANQEELLVYTFPQKASEPT